MLIASGTRVLEGRASLTSLGANNTYYMSFTVFLGNLPVWVTADDIKSWLSSENLVADAIKVIRNPETQESKGFAFIESPNQEEMNSIIRRFDRAPLEDRLLRANPAQPPKSGGKGPGKSTAPTDRANRPAVAGSNLQPSNLQPSNLQQKKSTNGRRPAGSPARQSAFAEELAKAL
ncbi:MAG: RNA-binding protein [Acidobacteriota bacterium]|nr:RNA-binding protein [Acidobacteriota bacterium]